MSHFADIHHSRDWRPHRGNRRVAGVTTGINFCVIAMALCHWRSEAFEKKGGQDVNAWNIFVTPHSLSVKFYVLHGIDTPVTFDPLSIVIRKLLDNTFAFSVGKLAFSHLRMGCMIIPDRVCWQFCVCYSCL
ncbi:hypothetical protein CEXT_438261 [Caerostris extrusa]|uniref:Uncharacterized protein n=1 Tax=Caerostris extrusa TaxID=172846 RepID=A0AAV4TDJ0_CAEEX|nr:hypothetical protein CEXT_438261 [Caerostris extrusa]